MRESLVHAFFEGDATPEELVRDLADTKIAEELPGLRSSSNYRVEPMAEEAALLPAHLVRIVDAVLAGQLSHDALGTLIFCIEASDRWQWNNETPEGERVAEALFLLGTPEINYPLTPAVLMKIRGYLMTGRNDLTRADLHSDDFATGEA